MYRRIISFALIVIVFSQIFFGFYTIGVGSGESMKPTIDSCDILIIDITQDTLQEVESGDIVVFDVEGRKIAHKLAFKYDGEYGVARGVHSGRLDKVTTKNLDGIVSTVVSIPFC